MGTAERNGADRSADPAELIEADARLREKPRRQPERGAWPMRGDWPLRIVPEDN